jgi:hypothetical protein
MSENVREDTTPDLQISPPTEPGFYYYSGGAQRMIFLLTSPGNGSQWYTMFDNGVAEVTRFVTGTNPDNHTTANADRILDVVQPILTGWNDKAGIAPIQVADVQSNSLHRMEYGDWIVKFSDKEPLAFVAKDRFAAYYSPVKNVDGVWKSEKDMATEELTALILEKGFVGRQGQIYQEYAENAAKVIINAGWRKVQK